MKKLLNYLIYSLIITFFVSNASAETLVAKNNAIKL